MSLELQPYEDFATGVSRLVKEALNSSLDMLNDMPHHDKHEVIHQIRKSLKKLRAIMRLIRDEIGEDNYQKENEFYRDQGREISEIRDYTAMIEALQQLQALYPQYMADHVIERPIQTIQKYRQGLEQKQLIEGRQLEYIKAGLSDKLKTQNSRELNQYSFDSLAPSLARVYKRGRRAYEKSEATRSTEDLHEWRKRVKYLRHQLEVLNRIWPRIMSSFEKELHDLSDLLGMDHDLATLQSLINTEKIAFDDAVEKALLATLIEHKRDGLQQSAFSKGRNFYCEKPDIFVDKIKTYWETRERKIAEYQTTRTTLPESKKNEKKYAGLSTQ